MLHFLCSFLSSSFITQAPSVPAVTLDPGSAAKATLIEAPISEVTVFSDRARIRRRAAVSLAENVARMRFPDLPGAVLLDTVRVTASAAKLTRTEASVVDRDRFSIAQVDDALKQIEALRDEQLKLARERSAFEIGRASCRERVYRHV
jgi:hypothetical protein